jgi:hypothetical protein
VADIVNLKRARKSKAREAEKTMADENRARFGRTKAQKAADVRETRKTTKIVDDAKLDRP